MPRIFRHIFFLLFLSLSAWYLSGGFPFFLYLTYLGKKGRRRFHFLCTIQCLGNEGRGAMEIGTVAPVHTSKVTGRGVISATCCFFWMLC